MSDSPSTSANYQPPVDALLTVGRKYVHMQGRKHWHNYIETFGFTDADVPELIRMATDLDLNLEASSTEVWAPLHAWRSLGQLRAISTIASLFDNFEALEEDDYLREDIQEVAALIGPETIPILTQYLTDPDNNLYLRWCCIDSLVEIWQDYPDAQADCLAVIVHQLQQFSRNNKTLNGALVSALIKMEAVDQAKLIKQAFAAKRVEPRVVGDWIEVQRLLGLISATDAEEQRFYVDAEHLSQKATKPISTNPKGFGSGASNKKLGSKKKKK